MHVILCWGRKISSPLHFVSSKTLLQVFEGTLIEKRKDKLSQPSPSSPSPPSGEGALMERGMINRHNLPLFPPSLHLPQPLPLPLNTKSEVTEFYYILANKENWSKFIWTDSFIAWTKSWLTVLICSKWMKSITISKNWRKVSSESWAKHMPLAYKHMSAIF